MEIIRVTTENSIYKIKIKKNGSMFLYRQNFTNENLRQDDKWIDLVHFYGLEVGNPATFILSGVNAEGLDTVRVTSPVVEIGSE